jgi:hypothetical protein
MQGGYFITLELTNIAIIGLVAIFILYNYLLVQLAPYIKKCFNKLYDKIVKRDRQVGFK